MDPDQPLKLDRVQELARDFENGTFTGDQTPVLLIKFIIFLAVTALGSSLLKKYLKSRNSFEVTENARTTDQRLAKWIPVGFQRPAAQPYPDWNLHTTKPIPYRPFRYGPYYITMGIRKMHWDEWVELDNQYLKYHARKVERIAERGSKLSCTAPEAYDGACELLGELLVEWTVC